MTISIKPTASGSTIEQDGSTILTVDGSGNITTSYNLSVSGTVSSTGDVAFDTNTLYVDATNNRVGIGTTTPSNSLHLYGSSSALRVERTGSDSAALITKTTLGHYGVGTGIGTASNCFNVYDYNASAERMRIKSGGEIYMGTTSDVHTSSCTLHVRMGAAAGTVIATKREITSGARQIAFYNPNGEVGTIQTSGTTTSYNTSSDYRLKENVIPMSGGIDRLKQLKPSTWSWTQDGSHGEGFLAHEAQTVVPEAVTGTKDAVDDKGNPEYQGIDQSKLVPLLTSALQEAITKIEALEARVATLEGN